MSRPVTISWPDLQEAILANPQRRACLLGVKTASASIAAMPAAETALAWLPGWKEDTAVSVSDAVSLFLWISDPLYRVAVAGVRRTMEMELASVLLTSIEKEWKARGGRHRGWVRKHLEEGLRARSAGDDPVPDFWENVRLKKRTALLLDYMCVVRGVRVAIWWPGHKTVTVIPLTGVESSAGVINLNGDAGHIMLGPNTSLSSVGWRIEAADWIVTVAKALDITWVSPMCVPSVGSQTIAQIQECLTSVGAPIIGTGGKASMWTRYMWQTLCNSLDTK
jgi:hypothetical protein